MDFIPGRGFDGGEHGWLGKSISKREEKERWEKLSLWKFSSVTTNWFNENDLRGFFAASIN